MSFFHPGKGFKGKITLGGDKSISHRLVLLSLCHRGTFLLKNLSVCDDVKTSLKIVEQLGCRIETVSETSVKIQGIARETPDNAGKTSLYCGNSGTTARLLAGILASCRGDFTLTGDPSLSNRPMQRIIEPLSLMGGRVFSENGKLPLKISGNNNLSPISYKAAISSAQVKSAILFAATNTSGTTLIKEPFQSRDHTERLLSFLGAKIKQTNTEIEFAGPFQSAGNYEFTVPGDISSAAYFVVAALLLPESDLTLENVLLNKTRIGFMRVLEKMGADVSMEITQNTIEPVGTIRVRSGNRLKSVKIKGADVPWVIDELPILAVAMAFAEGISTVCGASELRIKESDRILVLYEAFAAAGIKIFQFPDGYKIWGSPRVNYSGTLKTFSDHRLATALSILALASDKGFAIDDTACISVSFPEFHSSFLNAFSDSL